MRQFHLVIIVVVSALLFSCKKDLNIVGEYSDIPWVHAVLTPQENMQMIRINRAFLGKGNAFDMAKVSDSSNYKSGELTVMLERFVNDVKVPASFSSNNSEIYFRDSVIQTIDGVFSTTQRVYVTNEKLYNLGVYKLSIKNNRTGKIYSAKANMIDSVPLAIYGAFAPPFYPLPSGTSTPTYYYMNYSDPTLDYLVKVVPVKGAALHDLTIRMHYYDSLVGGQINYQFIDFAFPSQDQTKVANDGRYDFGFSGEEFYSSLGKILDSRIKPQNLIGRRMYKVDYISYAGSPEFKDYMQATAPSLTFNQYKQIYSNFENRNALGIFTIRTKCHVSKDIAPKFKDQFAVNKYTCPHKFMRVNLSFGLCQ